MSHKKTGEPLFNRVIPLSLSYPFIGEHICTYAYPGTTIANISSTNHVSFNAKFYAGIVNEYYPNGRDKVLLPFPCYRTSVVLHGGASGGPVFGQNGKVFGVNSTGFDGEVSISYVSRIHDALGLHIPNVLMPNETKPRTIVLQDLIKINHIAI